jgi:prolyl 3-hydroxylase /prolyl 3,4-dihydroxylase
MKALAQRFIEESSLELHDFLSAPIADKLRVGLSEHDVRDGLGPNRESRIPPHTAGIDDVLQKDKGGNGSSGWKLKGPPHKWRYAVLAPPRASGPVEVVSERVAQAPYRILRALQEELFPSPAFRAWITNVSQMLPLRYMAEARRFRPGLVRQIRPATGTTVSEFNRKLL